jgi:hypothetical protein
MRSHQQQLTLRRRRHVPPRDLPHQLHCRLRGTRLPPPRSAISLLEDYPTDEGGILAGRLPPVVAGRTIDLHRMT